MANGKFQELSFEGITFEAVAPSRGHGFKMWSQGNEKRFRFDDCGFNLGHLLWTEGTGNADLNRFQNCKAYTHQTAFVFNNPQSVSNGLLNTDITAYRNLVEIRAGVAFWWEMGNFEMHNFDGYPIEDHYIFNNPVTPTNAQGNADFNITDVRMEIHGGNKKLVRTTSDSGQLNINFTRVEVGTISGGVREAVHATGAKRVRFDNCILDKDMTFRATCASNNVPLGALIQFVDCDHGRDTLLHTRCTTEGDHARIIADGGFRQDSSIVQGVVEPEDFDYGWRTAPVRAPTPRVKVAQIKRRQALLPVVGATSGNPRITLPAGAWIKRIYVHKRAITGSTTGAYQLHIGPLGRATTIASSELGTFNTAQTIDVRDVGPSTAATLELWATGDAGHASTSGGDGTIAYVEYI